MPGQILFKKIQMIPQVLLFLFLSFFLVPFALYAQSPIGGVATMLTLTPATPQAGQQFTVRVDAYSYDMARAHISWSINGKVAAEHAGEQQITLSAPALGTPLSIVAKVTEASGAVHTATKIVTPNALDIILESDTRVPGFYRGRALPSAGSAVRLIAFPSLYTAKGIAVRPDAIIYTWEINNKVAKAGPGQNTLTMTMPITGTMLVGVTVESADGSARQSILEEIPASEPLNLFYEDNPLHGLSQNALPLEFTLVQDEISIRAEPYFVSRDIFNNATYEWTIADAKVQNSNTDPQTLTLRKTGGTGSSRVGFSIRNLSSLLQAASSAFTVYFQK